MNILSGKERSFTLLIVVSMLVSFALSYLGAVDSLATYKWVNRAILLFFVISLWGLRSSIKKFQDEIYLIFLGVSMLRLMFYLGTVAIILIKFPAMKDTLAIAILSGGFVALSVIEIVDLLRNLRQI